jgi:hypothetical protein
VKKTMRSLSEATIRVPVVEVMKNYAAEAAAADALILRRGRPKKGTAPTPSAARSVRMQISLWEGVRARAKALGISTNAALQLAAAEWTARTGRSRGSNAR